MKEVSEFVYNHFTLTITEKVTMEKPDPSHFYNLKGDYYLDQVDDYNEHVATRRSFHYELSEAEHGKSKFEGIDFFVMGAREARIFSQALGIDHKTLPLKGEIALPIKPEMIPPKLDSNLYAFYSPPVAVPIVPVVKQDEKDVAFEIVKALADWSIKYPRGPIYPMSQKKMDNELIEIEKRAKNYMAKQEEGTEATQPH